MDKQKINTFIIENKGIICFVALLAIITIVLHQNIYLATHLEECRIQNEAYKQNPPRIEPGGGGYDNWKSSISVDE